MALAHVAFTAAAAGKRVLTIDWDLEAPGLLYYFRALMPERQFRSKNRETKGLINLFETWKSEVVSREKVGPEIHAKFVSLVTEIAFQTEDGSVRQIDYLGPGCGEVANDYATLLGRFSFSELFDDYKGGYLLEQLRKWSKDNYEVILIDSRTGLADSSGICTIQMPDDVYLCFTLNKQSIDGTATVADAIRKQLKGEVAMHAVPMRLSRMEGNAEESYAISYAVTQFVRCGLLPQRIGDARFKEQGIPASETMLFQEQLLMLSRGATSSSIPDPLSASYLRLTRRVTGDKSIELIGLSAEELLEAKARLSIRQVSIEYLQEIMPNAEPNGRAAELLGLAENVSIDHFDEGVAIDADYFKELLKLLAKSIENMWEIDDDSLLYAAHSECLSILRDLYMSGASEWRSQLVEELSRYASAFDFQFMETDEVLSIYDEIDQILDQVNPKSVKEWENQYQACRKLALYCLNQTNDKHRSRVAIDRLTAVRKAYLSAIPDVETDEHNSFRSAELSWLASRVDVLEGNLQAALGRLQSARSVLNQLESTGAIPQVLRSEDTRLRYEVLVLLARVQINLLKHDHALLSLEEALMSAQEHALVRIIADVAKIPQLTNESSSRFLNSLAKRIEDLEFSKSRRAPLIPNLPGVLVDLLDDIDRIVETSDRKLLSQKCRSILAVWLESLYMVAARSLSRVKVPRNADPLSSIKGRLEQVLEKLAPDSITFATAMIARRKSLEIDHEDSP